MFLWNPSIITHTHKPPYRHKNTTLPCQREAGDGQRTMLQWWCHQACVLQLVVHWTGPSQHNQDPDKWTKLAAAKASSWSFRVTKETQTSTWFYRAITGKYLSEKLFSWPWHELLEQRNCLETADLSSILSSDSFWFPLDFKVGPSLQWQVQQCNLGNWKENSG